MGWCTARQARRRERSGGQPNGAGPSRIELADSSTRLERASRVSESLVYTCSDPAFHSCLSGYFGDSFKDCLEAYGAKVSSLALPGRVRTTASVSCSRL